MTAASPEAIEACFSSIERAAVDGRRCPENGTANVNSVLTTALAHAGRVRVEISGYNYRTVHILTGPHAGKSTKPNPTGMRTWKIVDSMGTRRQRADGANVYPGPRMHAIGDYRI